MIPIEHENFILFQETRNLILKLIGIKNKKPDVLHPTTPPSSAPVPGVILPSPIPTLPLPLPLVVHEGPRLLPLP